MTYRGLPAGYDAWKTRSDRDDGPDDEFEPEPEEDETDMDDVAKEIEDALKTDFPSASLKHKPFTGNGRPAEAEHRDAEPTLSAQIDRMVAGMESRIRVLKALRETL